MEKAILLLSPKLRRGGADLVLLNIANLFLSKGYQVHLLLFHKSQISVDPRITLHENSAKKGIGIKILEEIRVAHIIHKLDKALHFDLIISNKTSSRQWLNKKLEAKTFYYQHFDSTAVLKNATTKKERNKAIRKNFKHFNNRQIICVSEGAKKSLIKTFNTKAKSIHVIHNFLNFNEVRQKSKAYEVNYKPYILHAGGFNPKGKRQDLLLEAFALMKAEVNLVFLTSKPQALLELCKNHPKRDKIHSLPFEANPFPYMTNAGCLVLCSDYEAFGNVLLESLVCNTPAVSTNCCSGPDEILTGELASYLVPCGDAKALAEKIDKALDVYPAITDKMLYPFSLEVAWEKFSLLIAEVKATQKRGINAC
ncbi:glycosyltransferase [Facilibium subflavum]|uniref:glycosyltransferase n=1 Tax=Facilibium subflavum TaxID=2219058 RepID=UPI000E6544DB|nr:glycosyltransferase [Facilibium subflavum]